MNDSASNLFGKPGYLSIKEYVDDIDRMRRNGPWRLPLGIGDRLQLFFLKMVIKFSWFAKSLHITHTKSISPAYAVLFSYAQKKQFFDSMTERNLYYRGHFSYYLEKKASINGRTWSMRGQGVAEDKATAFSKALGEMLERAISGLYDMNKRIVFAAPDELMKKYPTFYPPKYHRFLDIQKKKFKELRYNSTDLIAWVEGKNLMTKEKTYLPRYLTSWFTENRNVKEAFINATTNGSAGYFTKEGAVLRGVLEVVQRDAFLVHWLTMIPPKIIIQETLPKEIQEKIQEFESFGISLFVLDITSLSIPSVCIVAMNMQSEIPQVVVSAASAVTFEKAIQDALREMMIVSEMFSYKEDSAQLKYDKSIRFEPFVSRLGKIGRQLYWRGAEKVEQFRWFISGGRVSYDDVCQQDIQCDADDMGQLEKCLKVLKNLGESYYPIVYYPENKIQKEIGFFIAQVYIPKAFPFYLFECYGTFDSDRLQEFALSRGVSDWRLNPSPHMFS